MEKINRNDQAGQGFAVAGLVCGIVALVISLIPCVGASALFIGGVALVFSSIAFARLNQAGAPKGMAIGGLTVSIIAVIMAIVWITTINQVATHWRDKASSMFGWNKEDFTNSFDNTESLEELENALNELEGVMDSVSIEIDSSVNDAQNEVKKAIDDAREEIKKHQDEE